MARRKSDDAEVSGRIRDIIRRIRVATTNPSQHVGVAHRQTAATFSVSCTLQSCVQSTANSALIIVSRDRRWPTSTGNASALVKTRRADARIRCGRIPSTTLVCLPRPASKILSAEKRLSSLSLNDDAELPPDPKFLTFEGT